MMLDNLLLSNARDKLNLMVFKRRQSEYGFTVIELVFVAIIAATLVVVLVVQLSGVRARNRDTARRADIIKIQKAVEQFYAINAFYPQKLSEVTQLANDACQSPNGKGTCLAPDYEYKAFSSAANVSPKATSDCDNSKTFCTDYTIFTPDKGFGAMEKSTNPYSVSSKSVN